MSCYCDDDKFNNCENNSMCEFCLEHSLFKNTKETQLLKKKKQQLNRKNRTNEPFKLKYEKEGMALEKKVQKQWNNHFRQSQKKVQKPRFSFDEEESCSPSPFPPSFNPFKQTTVTPVQAQRLIQPTYGTSKENEAQRQINSGAMWHSKGDIKLSHALMEVKERGTKTSKGEKTISIPKAWLEKQAEEAMQEQKLFWYLPFAYKNDDQIYLVKPYEQELQMIEDLRLLQEENEKYRQLLEEIANVTTP